MTYREQAEQWREMAAKYPNALSSACAAVMNCAIDLETLCDEMEAAVKLSYDGVISKHCILHEIIGVKKNDKRTT